MENNIKIWERQPDEPETIYHLLEEYLCQVGKRSYDYTATVTGKSKRTIERYAAKWNWVKKLMLMTITYVITTNSVLSNIAKKWKDKNSS